MIGSFSEFQYNLNHLAGIRDSRTFFERNRAKCNNEHHIISVEFNWVGLRWISDQER